MSGDPWLADALIAAKEALAKAAPETLLQDFLKYEENAVGPTVEEYFRSQQNIKVIDMATPHVHAELIKKWADDQNLLVYFYKPNRNEWCEIHGEAPQWAENTLYWIGPDIPEMKSVRRDSLGGVPVGLRVDVVDSDKIYYIPCVTNAEGYITVSQDQLLEKAFAHVVEKGFLFETAREAIQVTTVMLEGF